MAKSTLRFFGADVAVGDIGDFFEDLNENGAFVNASKHKVVLEGLGSKILLKGDFDVENGVVTGGTIRAFTAFVGGERLMKASGYKLDFSELADSLGQNESFLQLMFTADRAIGSKGDDTIFAVAKSIKSGDGDDFIVSSFRNKTIKAGDGDDTIIAGLGNDNLHGGKGRDVFVFQTPLDGVDRIRDFEVRKDKIAFAPNGFDPLGDTVDAAEFVIGPAATTADHRIIYDDATGRLYWDEDGVGGAAQVALARLDKDLKLTTASFIVEDFFT